MGRLPGSTGWIKWPDISSGEWTDSGEGGVWVYAFWPCQFSEEVTKPTYAVPPDHELASETMTFEYDPFVRCIGPESTIALPNPDVLLSDDQIYPLEDVPLSAQDREADLWHMFDAGVPVLAAVCLGTSGHSYVNNDGYWHCAEDDLTDKGQALLAVLNQLYTREPVLVTYLDT